MFRHALRTALLATILTIVSALPIVPGTAGADAAGYCIYARSSSGTGATVCS